MKRKQKENQAFQWIMRTFGFYPFRLTVSTLLRIIGFAGIGAIPAILLRRFFNDLAGQSLTYRGLLLFTLLLIAAPAAQALSYYADLALSYGWVDMVRCIFRRNILEHILKQPGAQELPVSHGQLMNCLREDISITHGVLWDFAYFLAYLVFFLIGFALMIAIDWFVTLVLFLPLLACIILVDRIKLKIERFYREQQQTTDKVVAVLSDMFRHVQTVKAQAAEESFVQQFEKLNRVRTRNNIRNNLLQVLLNAVYDNIVSIGTGILLLLIAQKIRNGSFQAGDFSLFLFFLGYMANLTRLLGNSISGYKKSEVSYRRILPLLPGEKAMDTLCRKGRLYIKEALPPVPAPVPYSSGNLQELQIHNLSYRYPGSDKGISGISLSLKPGSFTVICGKVASGKTTLLRVLLGLLPKDTGEIYWNGNPVSDTASFFTPPIAAYVSQVPHLFNETLRDNILQGLPDEREKLFEALHLSVLETENIACEDQLDASVGPKGSRLSGGQLQRAAAARMMVHPAELWVFDDVSSALDVETEKQLWQRVHAYARTQHIACLVVSNRKFALQQAEWALVLENGKLEAQGTPEYLRETVKNNTISRIYNHPESSL